MQGILEEILEAAMKRAIAGISIVLASLTLASCLDDTYGRGSLYWSQYPYSGWYDGYYGPIYDGYWGTDNFFYYRLRRDDQRYNRDGQRHFRRADVTPGANFHRLEGTNQPPPQGTRMPAFPKGERPGNKDHRNERRP